MMVVVATMKAKAGKENELIESMTKLVKAVKEKEPGALEYAFHRSHKDPAVFMVYERYESGEAFQAHMKAAHFIETAKKLPELLDGATAIDTYSVVA